MGLAHNGETKAHTSLCKCKDLPGHSLLAHNRRMAENGFAPPPREFCRHILSCRELKAKSFKRCLHSVLRGVSL